MRRYLDIFDFNGTPYLMLGDKVFYKRAGFISPLGPVRFDYSISPSQARQALRRLGGWLVQWGDGFCEGETQWYAVVCDRFQTLSDAPSKHRCEINRGLRNCEVRHVDWEYLGRHGYDAYAKAPRRYRGKTPALRSEQEFRRGRGHTSKFEDIIHPWAALHQGRVIAYAVACVYGKIEANYTEVRLDPDYVKAYPVYALLHTMNRFYLADQGFDYVYDGYRSTGHDTNFQEFLMKKFGFRKAFSHLHIVYRRELALFLKVTYPVRVLTARLAKRVEQLYVLEGIRRSCECQ